MMLDLKYKNLQTNKLYIPIGGVLGFTIFVEIYIAVCQIFFKNTSFNRFELNFYTNWYDNLDKISDIAVLGQIFYTHYVLQLLIAGLILYLAVIGVAFLTVKSVFNKNKTNKQSIFRQLSRKNIL